MSYTAPMPKQLNFTVNQHLYQTSNHYRCRVDYVIKLLASNGMAANHQCLNYRADIINEEKDFVLGYN